MHEFLSPWHAVLAVLAVTATLMLLAWMWQLRTRNATTADALWAACLGASAVFYACIGPAPVGLRLTLGLMGALWAGRLALHLAWRAFTEPEDGRYRYLRAHWDDDQRRFFGFYMLQALVATLFSLPFLAVAWNAPGPPVAAWVVAALVWLVSVAGEALADAQLARFRRRPDTGGRTCREGLWRYSRHPNYFFEWTHWFTYLCLALPSHWFWLSLVGPVLMLLFLYRLTGIPFTEAQALRSRGEDYRAYQRRTSALVPWPPKKDRSS